MDTQPPLVAIATKVSTATTISAAAALAVGAVAVSFAYAVFAGIQAQELIPQRQVFRMAAIGTGGGGGVSNAELFLVASPQVSYEWPMLSVLDDEFIDGSNSEANLGIVAILTLSPPRGTDGTLAPRIVVRRFHVGGEGQVLLWEEDLDQIPVGGNVFPQLSDEYLMWDGVGSEAFPAVFARPWATLDDARTDIAVAPSGVGRFVAFNRKYVVLSDGQNYLAKKLPPAPGDTFQAIARSSQSVWSTLSEEYFAWVENGLLHVKSVDNLFGSDVIPPVWVGGYVENLSSYGSRVLFSRGSEFANRSNQLFVLDLGTPTPTPRVMYELTQPGTYIITANISSQYVVWLEIGPLGMQFVARPVTSLYDDATTLAPDLWVGEGNDIFPTTVSLGYLHPASFHFAVDQNVVIWINKHDYTAPAVLGARLPWVEVGRPFRRADADGDGVVSINDAVLTLRWLYPGGVQPSCEDAADADDDGTIALNDAVLTLNWLFRESASLPPAPGPTSPGLDPTADALGCNTYSAP